MKIHIYPFPYKHRIKGQLDKEIGVQVTIKRYKNVFCVGYRARSSLHPTFDIRYWCFKYIDIGGKLTITLFGTTVWLVVRSSRV